jgi:methylmalonyl-CoA mutase C-terminal domain/subunit
MAQDARASAQSGDVVSAGGRVLVSKLGLDGHDVGAKVVARLLRDAGFEVIYLGIRQTAETVVKIALEEDVDVLGLSILSGSHRPLVTKVLDLLGSVPTPPAVVLGGVVSPADHAYLVGRGVRAIFGAGARPDEIVSGVRHLVAERRARSSG